MLEKAKKKPPSAEIQKGGPRKFEGGMARFFPTDSESQEKASKVSNNSKLEGKHNRRSRSSSGEGAMGRGGGGNKRVGGAWIGLAAFWSRCLFWGDFCSSWVVGQGAFLWGRGDPVLLSFRSLPKPLRKRGRSRHPPLAKTSSLGDVFDVRAGKLG